jgi:hypothetical protein
MSHRQIAVPRIPLLPRHARLTVLVMVAAVFPLALAAPSALAKSAPLTVSGQLDKAGYTVMAIGYHGKITSTHNRAFKLRLREQRVTLQLIGPRGKYAGPVVVGYQKGKAIVGVRAGAKLGPIHVLNGYARVTKTVRRSWVDLKRIALVRKQVPLGNGRNFGFVLSPRHNGPSGNGGDTDLDGVPNVLDAAASGSRVLNSLRSGTTAGPAFGAFLTPYAALLGEGPGPAPGSGPEPDPGSGPAATSRWMSQIFLDIPNTLNADAAGVTREQIDALLVDNLNTKLLDVPQGDVVKLDCHGLTYCSLDGTGQMVTNGVFGSGGPVAVTKPFPFCCTSGGDGFGILRGTGAEPLSGNEFSLDPHASSAKIGTGDMMTVLITKNGTTTQLHAPLDFVFNTVPALQGYDDGAGNAATISYPASESASGTGSNPAPVAASANGHIMLNLTWWRPQRAGIAGAGEPAFMDVGRLVYAFDAPPGGLVPDASATGGGSPGCSAASITTSDSALTLLAQPDSSGVPTGELVDESADQPINSAHTLNATLDLTKCLQDKGASAIPVGADIRLEIRAATQNSSDHANQELWFKRVS